MLKKRGSFPVQPINVKVGLVRGLKIRRSFLSPYCGKRGKNELFSIIVFTGGNFSLYRCGTVRRLLICSTDYYACDWNTSGRKRLKRQKIKYSRLIGAVFTNVSLCTFSLPIKIHNYKEGEHMALSEGIDGD
uniref:Uncharacterized protein n=1 Tax=Glossina brevipalpis TaxID=37001 RepID=A0A1A9WUL7_9MUSC